MSTIVIAASPRFGFESRIGVKQLNEQRLRHLRQLVLQQRVSQLSRKEAQLVTNLREALFERRSNMQKMFKSIDLNDDGIVTLEEFLHALEGAGVAVGHEIDRARAQVTEEEAARMLAYFDRSSTGFLHYNEFMRLLQGTIDLAPEAPMDPELARRIPDIGEYGGRFVDRFANLGHMARHVNACRHTSLGASL